MKTLNLDLGDRSYPIHIGAGIIDQSDLYAQAIRGKQVLIVSNETVAPLYLDRVQQALKSFHTSTLVLPDGEVYKTLDTANRIFDSLLEQRFDRGVTLLALGGGVIGDITGFAAACYQRGVDFVQVPTTLLAQVDSSVGGKTGVNHALGKNMIGAFHQPRCVIADTSTLNTLEDRELRAGAAEVIKYGLIRDPEFHTWLEEHIEELLAREPEALAYAIQRSCQNKADVVTADELEAGQRALLNLGHTFGHAIENGLGYGVWLHGEAIAAGMAMAADLSHRMNWISESDVTRTEQLLLATGLPIRAPAQIPPAQMLEIMAVDKKVLSGKLRLILLKAIGEAVVTGEFPRDALEATVETCRDSE